jgi:hypothetical protein
MSKRCKKMLDKNDISARKIIAMPMKKNMPTIRFDSWNECAVYFRLLKGDIENLVETGNSARGYFFDVLFEKVK